jgi:hypothetical protein
VPQKPITEFASIGLKARREDSDDATVSSEVERDQFSDDAVDLAPENQAKEFYSTSSVDEILHSSARSSAWLARKMERRINTHLFLGIIVGGVGLGVWWMSFYYGGGFTDKSLDATHLLAAIFPRITILVFIEILAGFFLRQYRIGVEDLKYFLELTRRAEAKRIAYSILDRHSDKSAQLEFARNILQEKSDTRLAAGESTTTLTAMEKEKNEMMSAVAELGERIESLARILKK